jgi:hypothetical protein
VINAEIKVLDMISLYCSNCGATIESNLKFCRRCGHAVNISEATTRTLDPPPAIDPATHHINSMPTGPSYLPPAAMQPMPAPATRGFQPDGQKRTVIILASLVGFLLVALVVLGIVSFWITQNSSKGPDGIAPPPQRPTASAPPSGTPAPPGGVIVPHPPMPPAPPATTSGRSAISREMIYPGAEINMEVNRAEGNNMLQLRTTDAFDKVVAWYTEKLRPTKTLNTVGPTAILRGEGYSAVINGGGNGVNIILKQERAKE